MLLGRVDFLLLFLPRSTEQVLLDLRPATVQATLRCLFPDAPLSRAVSSEGRGCAVTLPHQLRPPVCQRKSGGARTHAWSVGFLLATREPVRAAYAAYVTCVAPWDAEV